jgi:two-component system, NarL family, sensor histidine kinase DevS
MSTMKELSLTCEQLEERLAALHQASLGLIQNISLEILLARIADIARQQSGALMCALGVLGEDNCLEHLILDGDDDALADRVRRMLDCGEQSLDQLRSPLAKRITRLTADPDWKTAAGDNLPDTRLLDVPLLQSGQLQGHIYLFGNLDRDEFSADDQQVIETLAGYGSVAISNARLYDRLSEREHTLTQRSENLLLLNQLAAALSSSNEVEQILDRALSEVVDYLHIEVAEVFLRPPEGRVLSLMLHKGDEIEALWKEKRFSLGTGVVGRTAESGQPILLFVTEEEENPELADLQDRCLRQVACFPMPGQRDILGVLCVATCQEDPFDDLQMQFLSAISSWLGTAIENTRLNVQQRRVAILEERERIGMDLHDGTIQSIYAVGLTLEHASLLLDENPAQSKERIDQAINACNNTIRDIRAYILDLRPRQFSDENLMQGIRRLVSEFRTNTLIDVHLKGPIDDLHNLPVSQATALFHICQEALANTAKHARAHRVEVTLWSTSDRALLEVRDDGRGFDLKKVRFTLGHGLSNIQTRARNASGDVELTTEPGKGAAILAWVPLHNE